MSTGVVILIPVLDRPHNVGQVMDSIEKATPGAHRTLFLASEDDDAELDALAAAGADSVVVPARSGSYACKINAGYRASDEPLLFSAADDLEFHPGWLEAAASELTEQVQVVGTNDLGNPRTMNGVHSTHTLFTRRYIAETGGVIDQPPGVVLNEAYPHEYCDDEFVQTAMSRGVYSHALDSHVEHLHYLWGKGTDDATYQLGRARTPSARSLFVSRRHLWEAG